MTRPNAEMPALEGDRASGNSFDQGRFFSFRAQRLFQNSKGSCCLIAEGAMSMLIAPLNCNKKLILGCFDHCITTFQ
jgi:hypothetical protein